VRRALGATTGDVLRVVILNAISVIGAGAAIGLTLAAVSGRLIRTILFGVQPLDMTTFLLVTLVLAAAAALSILGPAWRVARIDPAAALRNS
jgi:ABC-type antimicrobial peptide transport system permease subunit